MSTETKTEKAPSKKKILNKAKYAVISAERAEARLAEACDKLTRQYSAAKAFTKNAQAGLDALLAA